MDVPLGARNLRLLPWLTSNRRQLILRSAHGFWIPRLWLSCLLYTPHFFVNRYLAPNLCGFYRSRYLGLLRIPQSDMRRRKEALLLLWFICPLLFRLRSHLLPPRFTGPNMLFVQRQRLPFLYHKEYSALPAELDALLPRAFFLALRAKSFSAIMRKARSLAFSAKTVESLAVRQDAFDYLRCGCPMGL